MILYSHVVIVSYLGFDLIQSSVLGQSSFVILQFCEVICAVFESEKM